MTTPVIIIGGGGHARVLAEICQRTDTPLLGFTDPDKQARLAAQATYLGPDAAIAEHDPEAVLLLNGLGSVADNHPRESIFTTFTDRGYRFAQCIHPDAILSRLALETGQGCQILAGALLGPGVSLGDNVLINSRAVVEHDCRIGKHVHISPGAVICGDCNIEDGAHIGAGAVLIQGIHIGHGTIVAAGAVVTQNVKPMTLIAGVPGKPIRTREKRPQ